MKPSAISTLCALVILSSLTGPAAAQQPEAGQDVITLLNMAVIDTEVIRRNSRAFKDIRAQIVKYRTAIQADIQTDEQALRSANARSVWREWGWRR